MQRSVSPFKTKWKQYLVVQWAPVSESVTATSSLGCQPSTDSSATSTGYGGRAFAVAGPSTCNSQPKRLRDPSNGASVFGRHLKHLSSQSTSVYRALEALARMRMRYINARLTRCITLHYRPRPAVGFGVVQAVDCAASSA